MTNENVCHKIGCTGIFECNSPIMGVKYKYENTKQKTGTHHHGSLSNPFNFMCKKTNEQKRT